MKTLPKLAALMAITLTAAHAQEFDNYRAEPDQWLGLKGQKFHLNSTNDQGNVCNIEGALKNNRWEDGKGCIIEIKKLKNGNVEVKVPDNNETAQSQCREYCGLNTGFEGQYRPEPAQCSNKGTEQMEAKFQAAYRDKHYADAVKIKENYLQQCKTFTHWLDELAQRNDLAISYYHAGNKAQCRIVLQPAVKITNDDEGVSDILREGKEYRLGYLNYDYHEDFINGWEKEGCMADVRKNIGYRIELSQFQISSKAQSGSLKWALKLSNQGWARPLNPRDIVVRFTSADGSSKDVALENTNLRTLDAGERAQWEGTLTLPGLSAGEYSISLGAPDPDARLAGNTRFSLRFANADSGSVQWNLRTGFLDTGLKVQVP